MADTAGFFGFDSALPDQVQPWEEDDKCEIDAVNDETFGTGAQTGDWEIDHKKVYFLIKIEISKNVKKSQKCKKIKWLQN